MSKRTNSKEVKQAIREHIKDYCEGNYQDFENNAKAVCHGKENYLYTGARRLAEFGEFIISNFDARAFIESVLDQQDSSKYDDNQVWELYCNLIGVNGSEILRNGGWF